MPDFEWKLDFESDDTEEEYLQFFVVHPDQRSCQARFEVDVKNNPFYHNAYRRIAKLKGKDFEKLELYRWAKSNTRVVYHPEREDKTVYVIETGTATNISYKKRR